MSRRRLIIACMTSLMAVSPALESAHAQGPVYVEILADQNRNSPDPLQPFDIRFIAYGNGNDIQGTVFGLILNFSNGNFIGTIGESPAADAQVVYSAQTQSTFASIAWNSFYGKGVDPDTVLLGLTSFSTPWTGRGDLFRIHVSPTDTGTLVFDSTDIIPPAHGGISMMDPTANLLPGVVIASAIHVPPLPDDVRFRITTSSGTDTLFQGVPGTIYFTVDPMGHALAKLGFIMEWGFSNGNIVGPISEASGEVVFSTSAQEAFESGGFSPTYGNGSNPESTWVDIQSFDAELYESSDWVWAVTFQPMDTGTIDIHEMPLVPPAYWPIEAVNLDGEGLPANFIPGRIVVLPCPYEMMGDVNQDAVITSADLIYFINYVFKSGPNPLPDRSVGDVNCSGGLGGADIIHMVNYIFKSGDAPCACIVRRI